MTRSDIIIEISKKLKVDAEVLKDETRFKEDLELDSIDLVELLMDVEEKLEIEIPDEKAVTIKTVDQLIKVILEEV